MTRKGAISFLIVIGCVNVVFSGKNSGEKIHLRITVPEHIKHQHHTNIVFRHKHHHPPAGKPAHYHHDIPHEFTHGNLHEYSGFKYGQNFEQDRQVAFRDNLKYSGKPHKQNHSYRPLKSGKKQKAFNKSPKTNANFKTYGNDFNDNNYFGLVRQLNSNFNLNSAKQKPAKFDVRVKSPETKFEYKDNKEEQKGFDYESGNGHNPNSQFEEFISDKPKDNVYDFGYKFETPNSKTEHYRYTSFTPSHSFDNDNNVRGLNHSVREGSLTIETTKSESNDGFPLGFESEPYSSQDPTFDENSNLEGYGEDYTDPNKVAQYTSDIQHGSIDLQNSNYNPDHGNDLAEYLKDSPRLGPVQF